MNHSPTKRTAAAAAAAVLCGSRGAVASAKQFMPWGTPVSAEAVPGASQDVNLWHRAARRDIPGTRRDAPT